MDEAENGTTSLEGLVLRLEALERENAELRGKVAALEGSHGRRDEAVDPRGSEPSEEVEEGRISRRRLLGKAGLQLPASWWRERSPSATYAKPGPILQKRSLAPTLPPLG